MPTSERVAVCGDEDGRWLALYAERVPGAERFVPEQRERVVLAGAGSLRADGELVEVVPDRAPVLRAAIAGLMPAAFHNTEQCANDRVECDHGRLKARLRPMRGLKRDHSAW